MPGITESDDSAARELSPRQRAVLAVLFREGAQTPARLRATLGARWALHPVLRSLVGKGAIKLVRREWRVTWMAQQLLAVDPSRLGLSVSPTPLLPGLGLKEIEMIEVSEEGRA